MEKVSESLLSTCAEYIAKKEYSRVAVQLPDSLLDSAPLIIDYLSRATTSSIYLLADSSYSSCCPDFISAKHVEASLIVHFGVSCGSSHDDSIDVLFAVEALQDKDYEMLVSKLREVRSQLSLFSVIRICLAPSYAIHLENIKSNLGQHLKRGDHDIEVDFGTESLSDSETDILFYIGSLDQLYSNFILQMKSSKVVQWDPKNSCSLHFENSSAVNKLLSQRYSIMQKVPTLSNIGILVGSLSSKDYLEATQKIFSRSQESAINATIISLGKVTEAKVSNFPDLDCFVSISCPNTVINQKLSPIPILTPFEFFLCLSRQSSNIFSDPYIFDLSPSSKIWTMTGGHVYSEDQTDSRELTKNTDMAALAAYSLRSSFHGLDIRKNDRDLNILDGLNGVASKYNSDLT